MNIEDFSDIIYKKEDNGICTATISRPEGRNAVTYITFLEIYTILEDMEQDKNAKVLILTGDPRGDAFTSGGYFKPEMMEEMKKYPEIDLIGFYFSKRAIIPEFSCSFLLPLLVGFQKAKEICYFGNKITAQEAYEIGLVNKILPSDQLMSYTKEQALKLIPPKGPSLSLKLMKKTIHAYFREILEKTLDLENKALRKAFTSKDFNESMKALKEKRDPVFIGR